MNQMDLLRLHMAALYTIDGEGRLLSMNEPWDGARPAPFLHVGVAGGKSALYFRRDLPEETRRKLEAPAEGGAAEAGIFKTLARRRLSLQEELCYAFPDAIPPSAGCREVTPDDAGAFDFSLFPWLIEELPFVQPCFACLEGNKIVSLCRSVRIFSQKDGMISPAAHEAKEAEGASVSGVASSPAAHEAGIETAPAYRGKGYAKEALFAWADAVASLGAVPLYSTLKTNLPSRRLAEKAGLLFFASGFHIGEA